MLHKIRMKRGADLTYTTKCEPYDAADAPLDAFYPDTEVLNSLPFDTAEYNLWISDEPFAEGQVDVAFPPLPFVKSTKNKTRFEIQNKHGRRLRTSLEYPATQAFIYNAALDAETIDEKRPLYSGISAVTEAVTAVEKPVVVPDTEAADELARAAILAAVDAFIRARFRPLRGAKLTSRDVHDAFIEEEGENFSEDALNSLQLIDISRRVRAIFGVTMEPNPTRIKGRSQKYWDGYTI